MLADKGKLSICKYRHEVYNNWIRCISFNLLLNLNLLKEAHMQTAIDFERSFDNKNLINESEKVLNITEKDKVDAIDIVTPHTLLTK